MSSGCARRVAFRLVSGIVACVFANAAALAAGDPAQTSPGEGVQAESAAAGQPVAAPPFGLRAAPKLQHTEIGLSYARETLSNNPNPWTDTQLEALHVFERRKLLIGRATSSERFGLHDNTLSIAGYHPLGERITGYAEMGISDTHRVLPRDFVHLQLGYSLPEGWGVLGGLRHVTYNFTKVDIAELTAERYFGNYRAAVSIYPSHSSTAGSASSYRIQLSRYYGEENNIQVLYANGTEVDRITGVDSVVAASVRSVALFGRHWLTKEWAIAYGAAHTVQGNGTRRAVNLALRYRF